MRRIIQFQAVGDYAHQLFALCDDGSLWEGSRSSDGEVKWDYIPSSNIDGNESFSRSEMEQMAKLKRDTMERYAINGAPYSRRGEVQSAEPTDK